MEGCWRLGPSLVVTSWVGREKLFDHRHEPCRALHDREVISAGQNRKLSVRQEPEQFDGVFGPHQIDETHRLREKWRSAR